MNFIYSWREYYSRAGNGLRRFRLLSFIGLSGLAIACASTSGYAFVNGLTCGPIYDYSDRENGGQDLAAWQNFTTNGNACQNVSAGFIGAGTVTTNPALIFSVVSNVNNDGAPQVLPGFRVDYRTDVQNVTLDGASYTSSTPISATTVDAFSHVVRFTYQGTAFTTTLSKNANSNTINAYTFTLAVPDIAVVRGSVNIANGETAANITGATNLGSADVSGGTRLGNVLVRNDGNANLTIGPGGITITGPNASDFTLLGTPVSTLGPAQGDTLSYRFDPSAPGVRTAIINIPSNDPDENPFTFTIQGVGTASSGSISIVQYITGSDTTVNFTSPTGPLNFALTTVSGAATKTVTGVTAGLHTITASDLSADGYGVTSITCNDGDSAGDVPSRTAAINLASGENVVCTFTAIESGPATSQLIGDYLGARNFLLLSHQPDRNRRIEKLKGGPGGPGGLVNGSILGFFPINVATGLPVGVTIGESSLAFKGSLNKRKTVGGWDAWVEGHIARFDDDSSRGGKFGVVYGGVDYLATPNVLLGFLGQFDWLDQSYSSGATVDGSGWMAGPYATVRLHKNLYFDIRGAWGRSANTINPFGTYSDDFATERWLVSAALIGEFAFDRWNIKPGISLQYIEENQSAYTDSLGVPIPSQTVALGDLRVGPRIAYTYRSGDSTFVPWIQLDGVYTFGDGGALTSGSLANATDGLTARVQGGLDITGSMGASLTLSGQLSGIGSDASSYGGMMKFVVPLN